MATPLGEEIYNLTVLFDFQIKPWEFLDMTPNQINLLVVMKERRSKELVREAERRKQTKL